MPWFDAEWLETHRIRVWGKDAEDAINRAMDESGNESRIRDEVIRCDYAGPDQDEMDVAHREQENSI